MGFFDFFKKNKAQPEYDSTDIRVTDLDLGFVFDYDLKSWEVKAVYQYDWGDDFFSYEYKIFDGEETLFLTLEEDDFLDLSINKKIRFQELGENTFHSFMNDAKAPYSIHYNGETFFYKNEEYGHFNEATKNDNWLEFKVFNFENKDGSMYISVEQFGEHEFEASVGKAIKEFEISNILPS
ncbi:MAG: DUF4178 domain-containing protein [Marinifilaceae bacterium]|jgi:hypothetical protein|nr:DUF4178 domain-containing protein [Marinifilaceae bacterium]